MERAGEHSAEMACIWNEFLKPHPFEFVLQRVSDKTYELQVLQRSALPTRMSVLFGEWLYNLRSALDYVIWAAAVHTSRQYPPPGEGSLQYPIYDDETAWKRNLYRLAPLADHHREMLHTMQPFGSDLDANFLGWLNRLARVDRHRTMAVSTARVAQAEPVLAAPFDSNPQFSWGERTLLDGVGRLARIEFGRDVEPEEIQINPRVGIDPEILEWSSSPFWSKIRFSERLRMMEYFVGLEITIYEFDTTGESMDSELLSEQFRADVASRRSAQSVVPIRRPVTIDLSWSEPAPSEPSSRARFLGLDFPPLGTGSA